MTRNNAAFPLFSISWVQRGREHAICHVARERAREKSNYKAELSPPGPQNNSQTFPLERRRLLGALRRNGTAGVVMSPREEARGGGVSWCSTSRCRPTTPRDQTTTTIRIVPSPPATALEQPRTCTRSPSLVPPSKSAVLPRARCCGAECGVAPSATQRRERRGACRAKLARRAARCHALRRCAAHCRTRASDPAARRPTRGASGVQHTTASNKRERGRASASATAQARPRPRSRPRARANNATMTPNAVATAAYDY